MITRKKEQEPDLHSFHSTGASGVLYELEVDATQGLSEKEIHKRQEEYGSNKLEEETTPRPLAQ